MCFKESYLLARSQGWTEGTVQSGLWGAFRPFCTVHARYLWAGSPNVCHGWDTTSPSLRELFPTLFDPKNYSNKDFVLLFKVD